MDERYRLWDAFLARWPKQRVEAMTLDEYVIGSGDKDNFCHQLEAGTERLGSIWGGSSFKFGVYRLKHEFKSRSGYMSDGTYAWVAKFGSTAEEAFAKVKQAILDVIDAAEKGPEGASRIDAIDLAPMVKWKIAFLYQNRQKPWIVPIFTSEAIARYLHVEASKPRGMLLQMLQADREDDVFALADRIWAPWEATRHDRALQEILDEICDANGLSGHEQVPSWLEKHPGEELQDRESFLREARLLFEQEDADIPQALKSLAKSILLTGHSSLSSMVIAAVKWDGIVPLVQQMREREEPFDANELDRIVIELSKGPFLGKDGKPKKSEAAYFLSLLLQSRWPEHFIEYRQTRIQALAKRLEYDVPKGSIGECLVKAGELAKNVRSLPSFQRLWGDSPYACAVVSALAYALTPDKWPGFLNPEDFADTTIQTQVEAPMHSEKEYPKSQILYGPPGTGKTYETRKLAVEICDGSAPGDREAINRRYRELYDLGRIRFVTFHQSFSYEDFVEGIRPVMEGAEGDGLRYTVEDGIFKRICAAASRPVDKGSRLRLDKDLRERKYLKMSIGGQEDPDIEEYCLNNGIIALGWGGDVDYSKFKSFPSHYQRGFEEIRKAMQAHDYHPESRFAVQAVWYFRDYMQEGDIVIVGDGLRRIKAIGEVIGAYEYTDDPELREYHHIRRVNWLRTDLDIDAHELVGKQLSQQTIYSFTITHKGEGGSVKENKRINFDLLERLITASDDAGANAPYVLIIDEINRANISKVFGELITLIEEDKRLGASEEIKVRLPYSREDFGVPANLYVIGTMNTADRSIAMLDTALRRRFVFKEIMPDPSLLPVDVEGINLQLLLAAMNARIETLYDRDHTIGHAYLMGVNSLDALADRFEYKVIPLLQEYFFDDWEKIRKVLEDDRKAQEHQFVHKVNGNEGDRYTLNPYAFHEPEVYIGIYASRREPEMDVPKEGES